MKTLTNLLVILLCGCATTHPTPQKPTVTAIAEPDINPMHAVLKVRQNSSFAIPGDVGTTAYMLVPQFELPQPWALLHLQWEQDSTAKAYQVESSPDLVNWYWVTNVPVAEAWVPIHLKGELYRILKVNQDGLNSLGYYTDTE